MSGMRFCTDRVDYPYQMGAGGSGRFPNEGKMSDVYE